MKLWTTLFVLPFGSLVALESTGAEWAHTGSAPPAVHGGDEDEDGESCSCLDFDCACYWKIDRIRHDDPHFPGAETDDQRPSALSIADAFAWSWRLRAESSAWSRDDTVTSRSNATRLVRGTWSYVHVNDAVDDPATEEQEKCGGCAQDCGGARAELSANTQWLLEVTRTGWAFGMGYGLQKIRVTTGNEVWINCAARGGALLHRGGIVTWGDRWSFSAYADAGSGWGFNLGGDYEKGGDRQKKKGYGGRDDARHLKTMITPEWRGRLDKESGAGKDEDRCEFEAERTKFKVRIMTQVATISTGAMGEPEWIADQLRYEKSAAWANMTSFAQYVEGRLSCDDCKAEMDVKHGRWRLDERDDKILRIR